jgi:hypothetical protein
MMAGSIPACFMAWTVSLAFEGLQIGYRGCFDNALGTMNLALPTP